MSCLTENTIVIKPDAEERLKHDLEFARDTWCRINGDKCVFRNKDYVVYIFDCNGDQPWEIMDGEERDALQLERSDVVVTETNYGDFCWTLINKGKKKGLRDTRWHLITYMKRRVTPDEFEILKERIAYSW